jgi:hypothetical protein
MSALFGDDTGQIVKGITEATNNLVSYRNHSSTTKNMLSELWEDICDICNFWTGSTYVGSPKSDAIKNAFQLFFEELMQLLLVMKNSHKAFEANVANAMLYRGKVYRYLGNGFPTEEVVTPIYDNIYVSWSTEPTNYYIESKLYGNITWLACEISAPLYGINLDAIGCSRANEHEIVFPTIEKCITEIKYISEDDDDET